MTGKKSIGSFVRRFCISDFRKCSMVSFSLVIALLALLIEIEGACLVAADDTKLY